MKLNATTASYVNSHPAIFVSLAKLAADNNASNMKWFKHEPFFKFWNTLPASCSFLMSQLSFSNGSHWTDLIGRPIDLTVA